MNIAVLVDIGVILVLFISAGVSFFRGFIREVLTVLGVFGGAFAAFMFGGQLRPFMAGLFGITEGEEAGKFFDLIPKTLAADVVAYASIFLLVFIILQLLSYFLSATVRALGLGPVDRTLGVFFGIARGILLLGILYLPLKLILPENNKQDWLGSSKTMFFVEQVSDFLSSFMPQDKKVKEEIETTRDKLKAIDVLGNKRIAPDKTDDKNPPAPQIEGYDNKAREGIEKLLQQKDTQPVKGKANE